MVKEVENLRQIVENSANDFGENIAFKIKKKDLEGKTVYENISYLQMKKDVESFGKYLIKNNLSGKRIAVIGKNSYEWILIYLGVLSSGGVIVPLDRGLLDYEIDEQLSRSEAEAIFYGEAFTERLSQKNDILGVCMDSEEFKNMIKEGSLCDNQKEYDNIKIDENKMSLLLFTSGTTSQSKAVMLSQKNIASNVNGMNKWEKFYDTDVNMALLPLHHTFGMTQMMLFLSVGMCTVFCEGLRVGKCLSEYGVSIFVGVPRVIDEMYLTIKRKINAQGKTKKIKLALKISNVLRKFKIDVRRKLFKEIIDAMGGKLRFIIIGAAPASCEVLEFFNNIGILSVQGYGLTETSPVLSAENDKYMRGNSVGKAIPGVEVKIDSPNEAGIGEIIARGDNIMLGYFCDEENTSAVIKDGWFYTGDMGYMDKDGFIYIKGRKKNVIVLSNGKNVFPEEIETLVMQCDAIKECIIYGEKDDVVLRAVRDKTFEGNCDEVIDNHIKAVNEMLISYKQIKRYTITDDEMEKTTTGKIKRYVK